MPVECPRCKKIFEYDNLLQRHLKRKNKCEKVKEDKCEKVEGLKCEYCLKVFKEKEYLKVHKCKYKDCEIRKLEMERGKEIEPIYESKKCRYCGTTFTENKNLLQHMKTCRKKEEYKEKLQVKEVVNVNGSGPTEVHHCDINHLYNQCQVNNNNINFNLVPFGQENTEHINKEMMMKVLNGLRSGGDGVKEQEAIMLIGKMVKQIWANKEVKGNHNVLMFDKKGEAMVYTEQGFRRLNTAETARQMAWKSSEVCSEMYEQDDAVASKMGKNLYVMSNEVTSHEHKAHTKMIKEVKRFMNFKENRETIKQSMKEHNEN